MIAFPPKLYLALEAVLYIAYNTAGKPLSSKDIAEQQGMPPRFLEQIMQRLVHAGILRGVRGPHGGYVLAREKRRITLADICETLKEDAELPAATELGRVVLAPTVAHIQGVFMHELGNVTLATLCERAAERLVQRQSEDRDDFII